jgi:hypothetical protein
MILSIHHYTIEKRFLVKSHACEEKILQGKIFIQRLEFAGRFKNCQEGFYGGLKPALVNRLRVPIYQVDISILPRHNSNLTR